MPRIIQVVAYISYERRDSARINMINGSLMSRFLVGYHSKRGIARAPRINGSNVVSQKKWLRCEAVKTET